jgi:hypothetical protein
LLCRKLPHIWYHYIIAHICHFIGGQKSGISLGIELAFASVHEALGSNPRTTKENPKWFSLAKIKVSTGLVPSGGFKGESFPLPLPFSVSRGQRLRSFLGL